MPAIYIGNNIYIKPHKIISIPEFYSDTKYSSFSFEENKKNLIDNSTNGILSAKGKNNLISAINWLLISAKKKTIYDKKKDQYFQYKVGFLTLTIPFNATPIESKFLQTKLLHPFLSYLNKFNNLKNFVWKLELTEQGQPHIHLLIDEFIHWKEIRRVWNQLLLKNNLLDNYKNKFSSMSLDDYLQYRKKNKNYDYFKSMKAYNEGKLNNWENPNSTDIHSILKIKNLAAYIIKYMAKNVSLLGAFKGRIWFCSRTISAANKTKLHIPSNEMEINTKCLYNKYIEYGKLFYTDKLTNELRERGEYFYIKASDWINNITGLIKEKFWEQVNTIRGEISTSLIINYV